MSTVCMEGETMTLRALSDVLWHERDLLDTLQYRLEVERLILAAGLTSHIPRATREIEDVLEQIRTAELGRSVESEAAARALGLPPEASLREIARAATPPWDEILTTHHREFLTVTSAISQLAKDNHSSLAASHQATQETLMFLQGSLETYDRRGSTTHNQTDGHIVDESL